MPAPAETIPARILRVVAKAPVHLLLMVIGLLWLVPTLGLLFTSILPGSNFAVAGWWKVFSAPSMATLENYKNIFQNESIMHALWVTAQVAVGGTVLPIL